MSRAQLDMFAEQGDLLSAEPASYAPSPERIRVKLADMLAQLRNAQTMPWDRRTKAYHLTVFPQMASVLPEEEAEQLRLAFHQELERLA